MSPATEVLQGIDPRTGGAFGDPVPTSSPQEVERYLDAAQRASGLFGASEPAVRIGLLRALADAVDASRDVLVRCAMGETGLGEARLNGEVGRTSSQLRLFADVVREGSYLEVVIDPAATDRVPARPDLRRWNEPLGPVLVFPASNFPFAFGVLGGDTASALASGCPVLVKAHGGHPGLSRLLVDLALEVVTSQGVDPGVFAGVFGDEYGVALLEDARVHAAGFTGSALGGQVLGAIAGSRAQPIPFFGELGSINPGVITAGSAAVRGSEIAESYIQSVTLDGGQLCTKPGVLFVPRQGAEALTRALLDSAASATRVALLNDHVSRQLASGLSVLASDPRFTRLTDSEETSGEGSWAGVTLYSVDATAAADDDAVAKEHFGPAAVVITYDSFDEVQRVLARIGGSLAASVFAEESEYASIEPLLSDLRSRVGRLVLNGWTTGVAVTWAMQHGGPFPSSTAPSTTSVGPRAIDRWMRPVTYQNVPPGLLPKPLSDENPWGVPRRFDGTLTAGTRRADD